MTARSKPPFFDPRPRPPCAKGWEFYHPWRHHQAIDKATHERRTCHHESGHLLAYVDLEVPFKKVWLEHPKTGRGMVEAPDVIIPIKSNAVISLAGPFAERHYATGSNWRLVAGSEGFVHNRERFTPNSDLADFWDDIEMLVRRGCCRAAVVKRIEARTAALIKEHWGDVQITAAALLKRRTLTERQVYRLLKRQPPKRAQGKGIYLSRVANHEK